jgi:hypothetical protein
MSMIDDYMSIDISTLRKEAEERLQWSYAHGHISIESLENRLKNLYETEEKSKIISLVDDLPTPESSGNKEKDDEKGSRYHSGTGKKKENYFSLMGSNLRTGIWNVPEKLEVCALLGSQILDFREARFPRKTVRIQACAVMGSIELKFPPGVQVNTAGLPFMGAIENRVESDPSGPRIEVEGFALMGSISATSPLKKAD